MARLCRVLGVSRSGFVQWRTRLPSPHALADAALDTEVAALDAQSGRSYERPRLLQVLQAKGMKVGHERVRRSRLRRVYENRGRVTLVLPR